MSHHPDFTPSGTVAPGFEPVRDAFIANFTRGAERGAALHVTLAGEPVVDLWGGYADAANQHAWQADTLVNVYSSTKGILALAMHQLADRGLLDFDAPVAQYWPEFARHGKDKVLVRHILTHTSGLPAPSGKVPDEAVYDWGAMIHALEESELFWEPGTQMGYHAATFGWLNGEVLRRVTGMMPGEYLRKEICGPLGADAFIGLTEAEQARAADVIAPPVFGKLFEVILGLGGGVRALAFNNPPRPFSVANTQRWREAQIPSSNGHASARGLCRVYMPLAQGGEARGVHLLSAEAVENAAKLQVYMKDVVTGTLERRSLGYMLPDPDHGDPRPPTSFGHAGKGGSLGFADPARQLAFGYVMNRMALGPDERALSLCKAVYACL